jgi:glutathione S-transferase
MMTLYGCPQTRSARPAWALEEAGAEYAYVVVDLMKGEGRTPDFRAINPGGKVPALVDEGLTLTESGAICTYIGDRFPESGLTPPPGTAERAKYHQWCFFVIGELEQPLWTIAKHRFALPADWRVPQIEPTAAKEFAVALGVFEQGLGENTYLLGDRFTAADILAALTLNWARKAQVLPESPRVTGYLERTLSRPALERARRREADGAASS